MNKLIMQITFGDKILDVRVHGKSNFVVFIDSDTKVKDRKIKNKWKIICSKKETKEMQMIIEGMYKSDNLYSFYHDCSRLGWRNEKILIRELTKKYKDYSIERVIFG